jgi:hypothetical protein
MDTGVKDSVLGNGGGSSLCRARHIDHLQFCNWCSDSNYLYGDGLRYYRRFLYDAWISPKKDQEHRT